MYITFFPIKNKFLDYLLTLYTSTFLTKELGKARQFIANNLEGNLYILKQDYTNSTIGRPFSIYKYYKLVNSKV